MMPSVADPFAEKRTAHMTMCKARAESPPLLTKPRNAHSPKLFTLTAMRKARAESRLPMAEREARPTKPFALYNVQSRG